MLLMYWALTKNINKRIEEEEEEDEVYPHSGKRNGNLNARCNERFVIGFDNSGDICTSRCCIVQQSSELC